MTETIFDKIVKKELPVDLVYEDEWVIAFHDINPQAPVHVLVIPKQKVQGFADLQDLQADAVGEFIKRVSKVAQLLKLEDGYRVVFNQGHDGQQTVDYIHGHILGGRTLTWPPG